MDSREEDDRYCSVEASTINIPDEPEPTSLGNDQNVVTIDMISKHSTAGPSAGTSGACANTTTTDGPGPSRKMESSETRIGEASITNEELVTTEEVNVTKLVNIFNFNCISDSFST